MKASVLPIITCLITAFFLFSCFALLRVLTAAVNTVLSVCVVVSGPHRLICLNSHQGEGLFERIRRIGRIGRIRRCSLAGGCCCWAVFRSFRGPRQGSLSAYGSGCISQLLSSDGLLVAMHHVMVIMD